MFNLLLAIIYVAFISLGLPDALLGSAWPTIYPQFNVPMSYAGIISMTISACTIVSALFSDRLTKKLGTGKVTVLSVAMTAMALFGFSFSHSFVIMFLWAVPYGLGAGGVDASLNNYVALHYESRHMSWLHCMWGIGISTGPFVMSYVLTRGVSWNAGYFAIGAFQVLLTAVLVFSLPLWKTAPAAVKEDGGTIKPKALTIPQVLAIRGAKDDFIAFFCYCALEQTAILWGSSYMVLACGMSEDKAAGFASFFCIGITIGRAVSGFMTYRFNDTQMIRIGEGIIMTGIILIFLPFGIPSVMAGLALIGLGCAPVYPCIIHSTPHHFGAENSQAVIGIQMAFAYLGNLTMPPLFGIIANHVSIRLFPVYLLLILLVLIIMHERLVRKTGE